MVLNLRQVQFNPIIHIPDWFSSGTKFLLSSLWCKCLTNVEDSVICCLGDADFRINKVNFINCIGFLSGRTGVLIACYLVFTNRISANTAIHYTRCMRYVYISFIYLMIKSVNSEMFVFELVDLFWKVFNKKNHLHKQILLLFFQRVKCNSVLI